MSFPVNVSFPSTVSYPVNAYYPGQFIPPNATPVPTPTTYHPDTISWRDRALADEGIFDEIDLTALNTFVQGTYNLGLRDPNGDNHIILELLPFIGGNLASSLTKLWYPPNASGLTNINFTETDYSRSTGLKGNGIDKTLISEFIPSLHLTESNCSCGVVSYTNTQSESVEIGSGNFSTFYENRLLLCTGFAGQSQEFNAYNDADGRIARNIIINNNNNEGIGFFIGNRLSSTNSNLYRNTVSIASSSSSNGGFPPTTPIGYFFHHLELESYFISDNRLGLIFLGHGIPTAKIESFNTLVFNFMSALGRAIEIESPTPVPVPVPTPIPKLVLSNFYNSTILADRPIRYWKLNDLSGTIALDSSGQEGHGTYNGAVGLKAESLSPSDDEYSCNFDGIRSMVTFNNPLTNANFMSIECLVKIVSTPIKGCFINIGDNFSGFGLGVGGNTFDDTGANNHITGLLNIVSWLSTDKIIPPGVSHIGLVATRNRPGFNYFKFFINGVLVHTIATGSEMKPPSIYGSIGGQFIGSQDPFRAVPALISKVALYDYELPNEKWAAHSEARNSNNYI